MIEVLSVLLLIVLNIVLNEVDNILPYPVIDQPEFVLQRFQFIACKHSGRFLDIAETTCVVRDNAEQLGGHPVSGQYIVPGYALDIEKLILGSDFRNRYQLNAVFLAIRCIDENVSEIAGTLAIP